MVSDVNITAFQAWYKRVTDMSIKKRKPDIILVLAVLVGLGVILTMKTQMSSNSSSVVKKVESQTLYQDAWSKITNQVNQRIVSK